MFHSKYTEISFRKTKPWRNRELKTLEKGSTVEENFEESEAWETQELKDKFKENKNSFDRPFRRRRKNVVSGRV